LITVIDSGICNLASVTTALDRIGAHWALGSTPELVGAASALLLPGVGSFADGMDSLRSRNLLEPIRSHAKSGRPIMGICLGMQMLADYSEEFGRHEGLGLISAKVRRLPVDRGLRVPNIGWCDTRLSPDTALFNGLPQTATFYFVHSYVLECTDPECSVGTIRWGDTDEIVAVQSNNLFGVQFHPERSQDTGLAVMANFNNIVEGLR